MPGLVTLRKGLRVHVRSWGDEFVLLDEASGDTHLVGAEVILALSRLDPPLASRVAIQDSPTGDATEEEAEQDEAAFASLLRLGLIELADR